LARVQKSPYSSVLDVGGDCIERCDDRGEPQIARSGIERRLCLLDRGLLIHGHVRIAAQLRKRSRSFPLQAC
jgi:hypothetical protein